MQTNSLDHDPFFGQSEHTFESTMETSSFDPEMLEMFIEEAEEILESAEKSFLDLEKQMSEEDYLEVFKSSLRDIHTLKGNSNLMGIISFEGMLHELESFLETFYENKWSLNGAQLNLPLKAIDHIRKNLNHLNHSDHPGFEEINQLTAIISRQEIQAAPLNFEGQSGTDIRENSFVSKGIRVDPNKLDELINLVGELNIITTGFSQGAHLNHESKNHSVKNIDQLLQISDQLRELSMSMRMVPISGVFNRMERLVYDISKGLKKNIQLVISGGDTEIDKNMIEKISDPILHLIRNAVDHGIEPDDERKAAGKSLPATIHLKAGHKGNEVWIQVQDDGSGLSVKKIREKATEKGMISEEINLDDSEIQALIFEPGFSTAEAVSGISGRGLGLDVVKKNLENMSGDIHVESHSGKGTTFTLRFPLTLALIETLLIRIDHEYFSIPLQQVLECTEVSSKDIIAQGERSLYQHGGTMIPYVNLRKAFGIHTDPPPFQQMVVVDHNSTLAGLLVDLAVDKMQSVIKPLGKLYENARYFSGASFIGAGNLSLILDTYKIIEENTELDGTF